MPANTNESRKVAAMVEYKPEGSLIFSNKNRELLSNYEGLKRAMKNGAILESNALLCDKDLNLHVELNSEIRGIIPKEEATLAQNGESAKDIAILTRVGKPVCFKVVGFRELITGKKEAILSRKAAQTECIQSYISLLTAGDIIPAKVTHLERFGAFCDIGCGIISLLSIDAISVSRITHPSERLRIGDLIYTTVKSIDERGRIFLSSKELLGTWEENVALFNEGQTVTGIVRSIENYGIFIELTPNLAGLAEYKSNIFEGQKAAVYIKSIIPEKMKIKLIIIDTENADHAREPLKYFVDTSKGAHLDYWSYSPRSAKKKVETIF